MCDDEIDELDYCVMMLWLAGVYIYIVVIYFQLQEMNRKQTKKREIGHFAVGKLMAKRPRGGHMCCLEHSSDHTVTIWSLLCRQPGGQLTAKSQQGAKGKCFVVCLDLG